MGWLHEEHPGHEGYIIGLIEEAGADGRWRELRPADLAAASGVERIKVACDCGWRSRVFHAGSRAQWFPNVVELHDERLEDAARSVWTKHLQDEAEREREKSGYNLMPIDTWT
jgi:hypothetical protein